MNDLIHQHCKPLDGPAMSAAEIAAHLQLVDGWDLIDDAIEKTFHFRDYHETIAFVNALAWIAHTEDHHPELRVTYNRCAARYDTHSVGGISVNDFICAAKVNALVAAVG
jgi:4a-hydroxytetrahydrobiopterin dehydratase